MAVREDFNCFRYITSDFITEEMSMEVIKKDPHFIKYVPEKFRTYALCSMMVHINARFYVMCFCDKKKS